MPMSVSDTAGGDGYGDPVLGPAEHTAPVEVDVTALSADEVDAEGFLKPGVVVKPDGSLPDGTAGEYAYGVVLEPTKVAAGNAAADLAAAATDHRIAVCTIGQIQRAIAEDNLGRVYNANEVAAVKAAGSRLVLVE